jgi:hypothetical protein
MSEADEEQKSPPDAPRLSLSNADFRPRDPLKENSQPYSTVTDLARLRG